MRIWIAAAVGGLAAFMTAAAFEWIWEISAIAVVTLLLGAVIVSGQDDGDGDGREKPRRELVARIVLTLLAAAALVAVAVPMAAVLATRDSRDAAAGRRLVDSPEDRSAAVRRQPYAATQHLQRALVLEEAGALPPAAAAAKAATAEEPTNWRTWFVLARIDARRGQAIAALNAFRRARALNPRSPLFPTE